MPDPEIPVLNVVELGIVRYVRDEQERGIAVGVSPTYTGCPATEVIQASIKERLQQAGFETVRVDSVLAPPWTSDWLTESAREKLREYGIAPPAESVEQSAPFVGEPTSHCPRCTSQQTQRVSEFALDAVQGAVPLHELSRAVRILQVHLRAACHADLSSADDRRRAARRAATPCAFVRSAGRSCATLSLRARAARRRARDDRRPGSAAHLLDLQRG